MCHKCNYHELLSDARLNATDNRIDVLEVVGGNSFPVSASDIYATLERSSKINRVTVYRILDLLVGHGLVERISTGGRAFYYGLAPNANHHPHPHFYCQECEQMLLSVLKVLPGNNTLFEVDWLNMNHKNHVMGM